MLNGHEICHGLAGMIDVTLHVEDRDTRMFGDVTEVFVAIAPVAVANGDAVAVGGEDFADFFGRIAVRDLHFVRLKENSVTAQACHACLKGVARAC